MKKTGGASLALQTYRFDGTNISSVFIISSLALFVVFLLLEKFFEMYNFGEKEYFKDVNRTCSFANIYLLFFVILSLLSHLGMASETNSKPLSIISELKKEDAFQKNSKKGNATSSTASSKKKFRTRFSCFVRSLFSSIRQDFLSMSDPSQRSAWR